MMHADQLMGNIAIFFIAAVLWDDMRQGNRLTPKRRIWLIMAAAFALISSVLHVAA
jgi:hypothetical protein